MTGRHRRSRQIPARAGLALAAALVLLAGAVFASRGSTPTAPPAPAATDSVLSVREECQQALTYPGRSSADRTWLQRCVHALATPTVQPSVPPTPTPIPSPTTPSPIPTPTIVPTSVPPTVSPTTPSPSPGDEWTVLRAQAGPDGPLTPMACPSAGYVRLDVPGQVLQNVSIDGCDVAVMAPNVVVRNVRIVHTSPEMWAIYVGPGATGVQITDVEVHGRDRVLGSVQYAVYLVNSASATITRGNFWLCADCVQGEHVTLTDTWMHDFANIPPGVLRPGHGGSHVDGFQCNADCDGTVIEHNLIEVDQDQTGAVSLFQDFGVPRNVLVTRNWLRWAGWTIYAGAGTRGTPTNIRVIDNIVDRGQYGWLAYWNPSGAGNVCSNNRSSTGTPLSC